MPYPWEEWPYTNVHQLNLDWVLKKLKELVCWLKALQAQADDATNNITDLQQRVQTLEALIQQLQDGGWDSLYQSAIQDWVDKHLPELIGSIVKFVFFGLSIDGHFVALVPSSWDWIHFDTILDPLSQLYGHLVLKW